MPRYGKIHSTYWTSADIAGLDLQTKAIGAYLLTSAHSNMIGCFRLPMAYAVDDLRSDVGTVSKGFRELSQGGFITHDSALSWVLIRNFLRWNPIENPNQGKSAAKLVLEVPRHSSVYAGLVEILRANPAHFPEGFINGLGTVVEPFLNPEPYPEPYPHPEPQVKGTSPSALAGEPAASPPPDDHPRGRADEKQQKAAIGRLFNFYCEALSRNPLRYTLTPAREKKALLRLQERRLAHGGDLQAAEGDLSQAIENLAASEWHRSAGHIDWLEQIFRSAEEFERRLNWTPPTNGENGHGNDGESWLDRQQREAAQLLASGSAGDAGSETLRPS